MELAKRDKSIQHLQRMIKEKQETLSEKNKTLHKESKGNTYLREIIGEYNTYFDSLKHQEDKQYNALQLLLEYITQITLDPTSTEEMLRECKYDQSLILAELKKINS